MFQQASSTLLAVVVLADRGGGAEPRVAGLPAVSRILIEAARAGARTAYVVPTGAANLARGVRQDLARAGCAIDVRWLEPGDIVHALERQRPDSVMVLSRRAIVGCTALRRLANARNAVLMGGARPLAFASLNARLEPEDLQRIARTPGRPRIAADPEEFIPLDRPEAAAREVLRRTGKATDGLVSRMINRPLSRLMSGWLLHWDGVRPVHLTVVNLAVALAMFACLILGGRWGIVAGGLLYQLASIVDGCDGEIARATFRTSRSGAAMDTAVDMASNLMFVGGLTYALGRLDGPTYWLAGGAGFMAFLTGIGGLAVLSRRDPDGDFDILKGLYSERFASGWQARAASGIKTVMSRDFFAFAFAVMTVVGAAWLVPWMFAGAAVLWLAAVAAAAPMVFRAPQAVRSAAQSSWRGASADRAATQGKRAAATSS
jgi:CDP-L-myo-inositol myo-inositolphosphotransferase